MAQFQADIQGSRGSTSRLGTKASGMEATVRSWKGQVRVYMYHDEQSGDDMVRIYIGHHGEVGNVLLDCKVKELAGGKVSLIQAAAREALEKECA